VSELFVADASVAMAWVHPAQGEAWVGPLLDSVASGRRFVVPAIWGFEAANSCVVLTRRQRISLNDCQRALEALHQLRPIIDDAGPGVAFTEVSLLAIRHQLTVYDASYLELAMRRKLPIATLDKSLQSAARREKVLVFPVVENS
jgi:predicted nucleic acid-binding protein